MPVINLENIKYITLYTGNNGSNSCTCKCPCCSQKVRNRKYQGTITQVLELFNKLPNIEQLYLFGNPDITVDTDFCHEIMLEAVKRNVNVCCSTSGVGGKSVLIKLLNGIPIEMVDYISFSFDGITKEEMSFSKGIKYPMEKALDGLDWALKKGYTVKVQPTLWSHNYMRVGSIINFFVEKGVKWFTFHIGSLESDIVLSSHQHLTPQQICDVHGQIETAIENHKDVKVRCPIIYHQCGLNDSSKWYCMHPERIHELLVIFTENGIKATHVPMASLYREDLSFDLNAPTDIPKISENEYCPYSRMLSNRDDTCCRYVSKFWNY